MFLCFFLFIMTSSGSVVVAMQDGMPHNATAEDYLNQYKNENVALKMAIKQANYPIIAALLEKRYIIPIGYAIMFTRLQELEDLNDLFVATSENRIKIAELIQVLKVFKAAPRKVINEFEDLERVKRVRDGNNALDFAQLSEELAIKVASILGVK